jgi:hypothetical protein
VTIPAERYRALVQARRFLMEVSNTSGFYKRTPATVREMARILLKHFPLESELEQLANQSPDLLEK